MPSGGARGRSGPAPDPNALRRDRKDDAAGWITLPSERTAPAPEWPLQPPAAEPELAHWNRAWRTPQATQWEAMGLEVEVALYVRSLAEAQLPGASAGLRTLVKQLQEGLGISLVGLQRNRWKIADSPTAATATPDKSPAARPARGRSSSRDRLRVVEPPSD